MRDILNFILLLISVSVCIWLFKETAVEEATVDVALEEARTRVDGVTLIAAETRDTAEEVLRTLENMNARLSEMSEMLVEIRVRREAESLARQRLAPLGEAWGLCF